MPGWFGVLAGLLAAPVSAAGAIDPASARAVRAADNQVVDDPTVQAP